MAFQPWRNVTGRILMLILNLFTAVALIFEGYNQGILGTVSTTPGFIEMSGIGVNGKVTDSTKQGGLSAAYYFGAMWGCFIGGWIGDKLGRKKGTLIGSLFCMLGAALQCGSQNSNMFICARVIAGIGIGFINAIIPPWVSELSRAHDRGSNFSLVFTANFVGITIASWINFGVRNSSFEFRWRFPLGFMMVPMFIVAVTVFFIPESPRWLMANNRREEAIGILRKVRGDLKIDDPDLLNEVEQLEAVVEASYHKRNNYLNLFLGGRFSGKLHLGRRAVLGLVLQQIQQWTGIIAIVTWSTELFALSGFDSYTSLWLSGLVNTVGIFGTAAAALVIDRIGRRMSLIISFISQGICLFLVAAFIKSSQDKAVSDISASLSLGKASTAFLFIFQWVFTMFNIVPCWLYGTEIWPQEVRAKGYSFTILGWAIGCGMTTFLIPIMLSHIGWYTFIFFGTTNIISMPIVWFFYVETAGRSLEEINLLFTDGSIFTRKNMIEYSNRVTEAGGNIAVAARRLLDEVDGTTDLDPKRVSGIAAAELGAGNKDSENSHTEKYVPNGVSG